MSFHGLCRLIPKVKKFVESKDLEADIRKRTKHYVSQDVEAPLSQSLALSRENIWKEILEVVRPFLAHLDKKLLQKNGFTASFLSVDDNELFLQILGRALVEVEARLYSPIRLVNIKVDTQLNFEIRIYLPKNNRFVPYVSAGDFFEETKLARLKAFRIDSIFVPSTDIQKFYEYSAQRLLELSEDLQNKNLISSVRELAQGLMTEMYARILKKDDRNNDHTRKIIDLFLILKYPGDWQKKIRAAVIANSEVYEHGKTVATYAVLFSMALGLGNQKNLYISGMLHDLGTDRLPRKIQKNLVEKMSPEEHEVYKTHTQLSVMTIQEKNLEVPEACLESILYHHEKWNGGGFPSGISTSSLSVETQILAIANRFEELTKADLEVTPLAADKALVHIEQEGRASPLILSQLREIF